MEINKVYNMDCLEGIKGIKDKSIDLTVTSPPYDNLRTYNNSLEWSFEIFQSIAKELYRVTKDGGVVVWVVGDATIKGSETGTSFKQALYFKEIGFNLHDTMICKKENYVPLTHNRYEQCFEYMFILSKGKPKTFNPITIPCKHAGRIEKYGLERRQNHGANHAMRLYKQTTFKPTNASKIKQNIFSYTVGDVKTGHPAPFPEQLAADHIKSWSNEGDTILEPFAGSGTAIKQAILLNRNYIGFEKEEKYYQIIQERIKKHTQQLKLIA
jgi:DNA modification methylase